ncbi:MAG: hypothetical protein QOJ80_2606 [Mycobacterium sp.]|nr:hypothetical protein [Mycobacterium sp.]
MLVDTAAVLVAAVLTPADTQDRAAFATLPPKAKPIAPTISHAWVDKSYTGQALTTAATEAGVTLDVVSGPKPRCGLIVQPRRWVAEPTTARSTTLAASTGTTKQPSPRTKASPTSVKSPCYSESSTAASSSARLARCA